jgi:beta-lactam-binding protein with PASTA domain
LLPPPAGTVIFQNPIAGATVSIGDPVIVVYSSGLMRLPDVGDSVANPINVVIGPNTLN